ncbi:MAG: hypothetical protein QM692_20690 [Thermomicrobiales bacterium]
MDADQLDDLSRLIASRRTVVGGITAAVAALAGPRLPEALAKKKKKKKRKKKLKGCAGGAVLCGGACVNTQTDAQHCGGCGARCGGGAACVGGACAPTGPGACPGAQARCGGDCVDTTSDENHCGACGVPCRGDLTCLSGACGCAAAGETACPGNVCANLQSDEAHCGTCGNACPGGQTCRNGGCSSSPCADDEIDCGGGRCIPDVADACCDNAGCGAPSFNDLVCRNDRCVCNRPGEGICRRFPDRRGTCHECCPGGTEQCPGAGDYVCHFETVEYGVSARCGCPDGHYNCQYNHPYGTCTDNRLTDPKHCGNLCEDCTLSNAGTICCGGACTRGCNLGEYCNDNVPCGPNCLPCNSDSICCNQGGTTAPRCIPKRNGSSVCYVNA